MVYRENSNFDAAARAGMPPPGGQVSLARVCESCSELVDELRSIDPVSAISRLSGMLALKEFQANQIRIQTLVHLACAVSRGERVANKRRLDRLLNGHLGNTFVALLEDPLEDVRIGNVQLETGNYRIFNGIWESADWHLQQVLDVCQAIGAPPWALKLLRDATGLLYLSDQIAERYGATRYDVGGGIPKGLIAVPDEKVLVSIEARSREVVAATFESSAGAANVIPFEVQLSDLEDLETESIGNSRLERRPVVRVGDVRIPALPTAFGIAIRRSIMEAFRTRGGIESLTEMLKRAQTAYCFSTAELGLRGQPMVSAETPRPVAAQVPERLFRFDDDKVAQVILTTDSPESVLADGFASIPDAAVEDSPVFRRIEEGNRKLLEDNSCKAGLSILVFGGFGGAARIALPRLPEGWDLLTVSLPDLILWGAEPEADFLTLWKMARFRETLASNGVNILNVNDDLNLFAFWKEQDYRLLPRDAPYPTDRLLLAVPNDSIEGLRRRIQQSADLHSVWCKSEHRWIPVSRQTALSFFAEDRTKAIYVARVPVRPGYVSGVIASGDEAWWVHAADPPLEGLRGVASDMWQAVLHRLHDLRDDLEAFAPGIRSARLSFAIEFEGFDGTTEGDLFADVPPSPPQLIEAGEDTIVSVGPGFLQLLHRVENDGEREILSLMVASAIGSVLECRPDPEKIEDLVERGMGSAHSRYSHVLKSYQARDVFRDQFAGEPHFVREHDMQIAGLGIGFLVAGTEPDSSVVGLAECPRFLNALVDEIWHRIRDRLRECNRAVVVQKLLLRIEHLGFDEAVWNRTARAVSETHRDQDNVISVSRDREHRRSGASLAFRIAAEMAVCEASLNDELGAPDAVIDAVAADILHLLDIAQLSDAMHHGLSDAEIRVSSNGEVLRDVTYVEDVVEPYTGAYFQDQFRERYDQYEQFFDDAPVDTDRDEDPIPVKFDAAFSTEFGITATRFAEIAMLLQNFAVEIGSPTPVIRRSEILRELSEHGIPLEAAEAFIGEFVFGPRPRWDLTPEGYSSRDWYPWKYRRRLSLLARPLAQVDDGHDPRIAFGVGLVDRASRNLISRCLKGWLPEEFFKTVEMQSWIGGVNDRLGAGFENSVRDVFRSFEFQAEAHVEMSRLGGDQSLGDVDVVAWDSKRRKVFLVECKRLQFAMTIGEIGEQLRRFRGEAKDELARHVARVDFIESNRGELSRLVGIEESSLDISGLVVASTAVPMSYVAGLPVPPSDILSVGALERRIANWQKKWGKKRRRRRS